MPAYRNTSRNNKDQSSCNCKSEPAVGCTCQKRRRTPRAVTSEQEASTSSTQEKPHVSRTRYAKRRELPLPTGPPEYTMSSFQVNNTHEVVNAETTHETEGSVALSFPPTIPSQEQLEGGRAGRAQRRSPTSPIYSPPPHPPPLSPFSSSSSLSTTYDDNGHTVVMPSPHRPTAFPSASEYAPHYLRTPPGRPRPSSSMVSNSPAPPVTYSSSSWPDNQHLRSYYGSTSSDTTLSSPFNYSQRSFGSDSIGSQYPSPAVVPTLSFGSDSPAPRTYLSLDGLNQGNFVEQSSAGDTFGEFSNPWEVPDFPPQDSVPQDGLSYENDLHPHFGPESSTLWCTVDPEAVNTSSHRNWVLVPDPESSSLFATPRQGYP